MTDRGELRVSAFEGSSFQQVAISILSFYKLSHLLIPTICPESCVKCYHVVSCCVCRIASFVLPKDETVPPPPLSLKANPCAPVQSCVRFLPA